MIGHFVDHCSQLSSIERFHGNSIKGMLYIYIPWNNQMNINYLKFENNLKDILPLRKAVMNACHSAELRVFNLKYPHLSETRHDEHTHHNTIDY